MEAALRRAEAQEREARSTRNGRFGELPSQRNSCTGAQLDWLSAVAFCFRPRLSPTAVTFAVLIRSKVDKFGCAYFADDFARNHLGWSRKTFSRVRQELSDAGFVRIGRHSSGCCSYALVFDKVEPTLAAMQDRQERRSAARAANASRSREKPESD